MQIRRAQEKDAERVLALLSQVLELHAALRPDIFISGTTKYSRAELLEIFRDDSRPVFVAVDENDSVVGYAFCVLESQPRSVNMVPFDSIYIDDLCVDAPFRGQGVASLLFERVKEEATARGCYEITLNVWEGNDAALAFYRKKGFAPEKTKMEFILPRDEK